MKFLIVLGTRPECIKLVPIIHELEKRGLQYKVCVTAQHVEMLNPFLKYFKVEADYNLAIMKPGQDLYHITTEAMLRLKDVLRREKPDAVITQGDTTTAFAASLAAFYEKIPVGHVEAGLRTYDLHNPFPEEMNRRLIDQIAEWLFVPTQANFQNLLKEGIDNSKITLTGNTVVDTLLYILNDEGFQKIEPPVKKNGGRMILVTAHRRESFGQKMENLCYAISEIVSNNDDVEIVYPVHLNPNVREPVFRILKDNKRIHLIEPQTYLPFLKLMQQSDLILTDSGGVQEEAPTLGKPVLIMRETTERREGVDSGVAQIVGTSTSVIVETAQTYLDNPAIYKSLSSGINPYGDGQAAGRIVEAMIY